MADINKIKIDELPKKDEFLTSDSLVVTDGTSTYNADVEQLKEFMRENLDFTDEFIEKETIGVSGGIVPLNTSKKINGEYITYGTSANTAYSGAKGKSLETNFNNHISDGDAHGYTERIYENLIPYPYYDIASGASVTKNGLTITDNGDGTVTVGAGTATAQIDIRLIYITTTDDSGGIYVGDNEEYTLSGCPEGGSGSTYMLWTNYITDANEWGNYGGEIGNSLAIVGNNKRMAVNIRIKSGTVISEALTFKPMLEYGTVAHKYKPYSISNAGLQDQIDNEVSRAKSVENKKANLASPTLTGTPKAPTASTGTNSTQIATTAFVQTAIKNALSASDAMIIKGTIGTSGTVTALPTTYKTGWTYRVVTAGTYASCDCEVGDLIIALVDRSGSNNADSDWCVAQTNIDGAITGVKTSDSHILVSQTGSVVTLSHSDIDRTDKTSTAKPSYGGTFTAIKSITSDNKGHITAVETETVTIPSSDNTDSNVKQVNSTDDADYRVLFSANANDTTSTSGARKSVNFTANPATGAFYAKGYNRIDITGETIDLDTYTLEDGTVDSMRFICKTDGGSTNISNIPVTGKPFTLDVELTRWASSTDYVTTHRFVSRNALNNEYFRYCTNGTWSSWTKRVFTDTNTHYASLNVVGESTATSNTTTALTNGNVYLNSVENGKVTSSHNIVGSGGTTVSTDENGNIIINSAAISDDGEIIVDEKMSATSTNPVQNKVVSAEFEKYLPLSGGVLSGSLGISGVASSHPFIVRGIVGSSGDGKTIGDLYLQYEANAKVTLGNEGKYYISEDGSSYSGNSSSATKLATARSINGMSFNGTANVFNYGTCSTAASTTAKTVACSNFVLATGAEIVVKFTVTNTASSPTLNVNGTGAKPIYYRGAVVNAGVLASDRTYAFRYNGTQYDIVGDVDTNSYDRIKYGTIKCGSTAISAYNLIVGKNGVYEHLKFSMLYRCRI